MADENFAENLLRMIAAELWLANRLSVSRELLGKSYLSLSVAEKASVDQLVFGAMAADYQTITPETLQTQKAGQPMGFQAPAGTQNQRS